MTFAPDASKLGRKIKSAPGTLALGVLALLLANECHCLSDRPLGNENTLAKSARFSLSDFFLQLTSPIAPQQPNRGKTHIKTSSSTHKCGHSLHQRHRRSIIADRSDRHDGRIVNGRRSSIKEFPWMVSLQREKELLLGFRAYTHSCGGSMITPSWILTAAHCLYKRDEPLRAVAGVDSLNKLYKAQVRSIKQQIYHPRFNLGNYDNDVALVKVDQPFDLNSKESPVGLVCLSRNAPIMPYDIATICGFGARAFRGKARTHLYETEIAIIDQRTCNSSFGNAITNNMICAGGMIQNKRDACSGDSGGPLLLNDDGVANEIGIVSFGNDCAVKNFPGIYTRVSSYYDWILEHIDEPLGSP